MDQQTLLLSLIKAQGIQLTPFLDANKKGEKSTLDFIAPTSNQPSTTTVVAATTSTTIIAATTVVATTSSINLSSLLPQPSISKEMEPIAGLFK